MSTAPATYAPASWASREMPSFRGALDSHLKTGEDYNRITLGSLFSLVPGDAPKSSGLAFIPSTYADYNARAHDVQRQLGEYVALTGDIDSGDHAPRAVQDAVKLFTDGAAWLIYSSPHSRPGDRRWRIILPLADLCHFDTWNDAQNAFYDFMGQRGFVMDRALARAAQPVYAPNVPAVHDKSGTALRDDTGKPLFFQRKGTPLDAPGLDLTTGEVAHGIAVIRRKRIEDEAAREQLRKEAEKRRADRPAGDGANLTEVFNQSTTVADMLAVCGYEQCPRHPQDWRSPLQTGTTYATRVMGDKWVSLSESDASAGLGRRHGAGCFGDAYDLFLHFKHGGEHKSAWRAIGAEQRASNVVYGAFDPPPIDSEDPGWTEPPEGMDGEPDFEPAMPQMGGGGPTSARSLAFEWAGKAAPVIDGFWLVEDWLPKSGIAAVYGHPGSGKSFFTLDVAAHIAAGIPWCGKAVERGLVVYVIAEGQSGFRNRLFAMQEMGRIAPDAPFIFIPTPIDMQSPDGDTNALAETIAIACEQAGMPPALVAIDTLSKTFGAGKENTDDMVGYINNCQRIASQFDCLTLIVHHRPKDSESRDLRGHSSLRGNIDTAILIEAGQVKTATTIKQKDGEDNLHIRFQLDRVVIGNDRKGKEVSTCVVSMVDGETAADQLPPEERRKARLTGHKRTALNAIEEVIAKAGVEPPADIPADAIDRYRTWKAAPAAAVRDRLKNEFLAISDGEGEAKQESAKRNTFRVLKALKSAGVIGSFGDWIWVN